jgi:transcriptional regulator with XRE-family HTH domain
MTRAEAVSFCERMGHRVRSRRLFLGLTQEQVSLLAGMNVQQLRKYEAGSAEPQAYTLLQLARALEYRADFLLGQDDGETKSAVTEFAEFMADKTVAAIMRRLKHMDAAARKRALMLIVAGEESRA